MPLDPVKNFAKVTVSTGYDAAATSIVLSSGHGAKLPDPSTDGAFNLVWWNDTDYKDPADDPNIEIVRCTARATDTLTVTRGQEGITATIKNTTSKTYKMVVAMTKKMKDDIGTDIAAAVGYWVKKASATFSAVTSFQIASLDLDTDRIYKLTIVISVANADATFLVRLNNDATAANYRLMYHAIGENAAGTAINEVNGDYPGTGISIGAGTSGTPVDAQGITFVELMFYAGNGLFVLIDGSYTNIAGNEANANRVHAIYGGVYVSATNITTIDVVRTTGTGTITGKYFLEKLT